MNRFAILLLLLSLCACEDDLGFTNFCEDVSRESENDVADYVNDILDDLGPIPTFDDAIGHEENLFFLVDELIRRNDCIQASIDCYACVKTFPLLSEIRVDVLEVDFINTKIIDIATPEIGEMYFDGMHP